MPVPSAQDALARIVRRWPYTFVVTRRSECEYDGRVANIRCFTSDQSVASSLKFLRKTPWARAKVESLYLFMLREQRRQLPHDSGG